MAALLDHGWEAAATAPDACGDPAGLDALGLDWLPARVPGTAAAALAGAGRWRPGEPAPDLDAQDWWFRTRFAAEGAEPGEEVLLGVGGIATSFEVHLNGERILTGESMFQSHMLDVGSRLRGENELAVRCRALGPLLAVPRRPRARWRTRVADGALRFQRTTILGRAPGFAPGPAAVGPYRPITLERRRGPVLDGLRLRPRMAGTGGLLAVRGSLRGADRVEVELSGPSGEHRMTLHAGPDGELGGELVVPRVARWWPHTHGEPVLHDVRLLAGEAEVATARVGFRDLADAGDGGLALEVNGVPVFARGAVWTTADPVGLAPAKGELRAVLERVRDGGMNLLRVVGTATYETAEFHDLCDELGLLVWQDLMFANFDYPLADDGFRALVEDEVRQALDRVGGRPSLAVLCGNSEVEQQVAMLGLDPALGRGELFGELLPRLAREAEVDVPYLASAPSGGTLPFRTGTGVANYFGVGGYRRPLEDARRAEVRFASECLAFANVPGDDDAAFAGVPRDAGADWDFADVRDHYLALLHEVDPTALRAADPARYLALSREVSGEVMAETLGEWRRAASPCAGALVLWLRDLAPGSGWGLLDHAGEPKVAFHHLRRALAPIAVWTTGEGLDGIAIHVANDRPEPLEATLRVALYRDLEVRVEQASETVAVPPHTTIQRDVEGVIGRFVDAAYAYRFGPPGHDAVVVSLERGGELLSQAVRFPAGRPATVEPADRLGLEARAVGSELTVRSRRLAHGVRIHADGFDASDDAFTVEPGGERVVTLIPARAGAALAGATLTALNLRGSVPIR